MAKELGSFSLKAIGDLDGNQSCVRVGIGAVVDDGQNSDTGLPNGKSIMYMHLYPKGYVHQFEAVLVSCLASDYLDFLALVALISCEMTPQPVNRILCRIL